MLVYEHMLRGTETKRPVGYERLQLLFHMEKAIVVVIRKENELNVPPRKIKNPLIIKKSNRMLV